MHKRIFTTCLALFALLVISPGSVLAQQFTCLWHEPAGPCDVSYDNPDQICPMGSDPSPICSAITDRTTCLNAINRQCPAPNVPTGYCYACVNSQCALVDPDIYGFCPYPGTQQGLQSCYASCTQHLPVKFKCENNSCVADENGPYSTAPDCEAACVYGQAGIGGNGDPTCDGGNGIDTAIGCIPVANTNDFVGFVLGWGIGIGGGISFILIVYSSIMVTTSTGNPERLKAGQELLTSAISGLIMLIFSLFILELIGVKILNIPGLTN